MIDPAYPAGFSAVVLALWTGTAADL